MRSSRIEAPAIGHAPMGTSARDTLFEGGACGGADCPGSGVLDLQACSANAPMPTIVVAERIASEEREFIIIEGASDGPCRLRGALRHASDRLRERAEPDRSRPCTRDGNARCA